MRRSVLALCCVLAPAAPSLAAPVAVVNAGFEDVYVGSNLPVQYAGVVPTGSFPTGPAPGGWSIYYEGGPAVPGAFVGVLNPGTAADHAPEPAFFPAGAPEGANAVLLYTDGDAGGLEYGVEQTLTASLQADTTYTLSVAVGNIASGTALIPPYSGFGFYDLRGFPGYRVQLLAGGQVVAEDSVGVLPADGVFEVTQVVYVSGAAPAQIGQALGIRLVNRNQPDVAGVTGIEVDFDQVTLDATPSPMSLPLLPSAIWLVPLLLLATALPILKTRSAERAERVTAKANP